jgi:hypothetical protein
VYFEDGLIWATGELARRGQPRHLPQALRDYTADFFKDDPWRLAGEGWRTAVVDAVSDKVRGNGSTKFGLNTSGPRTVATVHGLLLGENLLSRCRWQGMSPDKAKRKLAELETVRGSVAHTGRTPGPLNLQGARERRSFVERLATCLDQELVSWAEARLADGGWDDALTSAPGAEVSCVDQ